ncbi:hypothetical protein [Streptomyces sp. NPDC058653]|uniref:hypothetical protein n=1 Tax=Streptomyces sp. NPDC058653 TaxID=3346576 RepID=UPI0036562C72
MAMDLPVHSVSRRLVCLKKGGYLTYRKEGRICDLTLLARPETDSERQLAEDYLKDPKAAAEIAHREKQKKKELRRKAARQTTREIIDLHINKDLSIRGIARTLNMSYGKVQAILADHKKVTAQAPGQRSDA